MRTDRPFTRADALAAVLVHPPGAVVSHHTAAKLQGLPVPHRPEVVI